MGTRVAVLGAGSWGTTVASLLCGRADTSLWSRREALAGVINRTGRNPDYLGGPVLPAGLKATASMAEAVGGADLVLMAVPSHGFRSILTAAVPHLAPGVPVVSLTKGVEQGSLKRMTEIVADLAPGRPIGVLTGPNLAGEIMAGQPAASVVAVSDGAVATHLQTLLSSGSFRVYTNPDVVGCEVAGALKNVVAIACGMADGMGLGDNTRAALITRGLAELSRLGAALGGQAVTFSGLAGMGDLVVTCISPQSRNRFVGQELGQGLAIEDIVASMNMVAEGVKTARAVVELAARVGVEMPIAEQVVAVLDHARPARACIQALMERLARPESE